MQRFGDFPVTGRDRFGRPVFNSPFSPRRLWRISSQHTQPLRRHLRLRVGCPASARRVVVRAPISRFCCLLCVAAYELGRRFVFPLLPSLGVAFKFEHSFWIVVRFWGSTWYFAFPCAVALHCSVSAHVAFVFRALIIISARELR